jgi:hypothetical protein
VHTARLVLRIHLRSARATWLLTLVGLALAATPLFAQGTGSPSLGGAPADSVANAPATTPPPTPPPAAKSAPPPATKPVPAGDNHGKGTYYATVWTPRSRTGEFNIHGGVFAPIDGNATSATLGTRFGLDLGTHVLLGVLGDWSYGRRSRFQPVSGGLPGFEPQIELARVTAQLIPVMLFLQVKLTDKFWLVPYAGIGGGYEWLILNVHDYQASQSASRTYADLAWQTYGGLGLRLSPGVRLDGEAFFNSGRLGRDVVDQSGQTWRETVNVDGLGLRVGLDAVY